MSSFEIALGAFHFIRPYCLLLIPFIAWVWWRIRRQNQRRDMPTDHIAPHLREALTVGNASGRQIMPIDGVALALALLAIGAAGPTWSRMPDPFVAQSAPVVVVLKVAPSMEETDIAPSRLERAKQKIRDLLSLRAGARTALLAYAGSTHGVVPMTEDPDVMTPYLAGLTPEIMPRDGARAADALVLAEEILASEAAPGGILFVTDGLDPADASALDASEHPVAVLEMLPEGTADRGLDALTSVQVVRATPNDEDIRRIDRLLNAAYRQAMLENADQPWLDRGHLLAWPVALLTLLWFRRGWTMRWSVIVLAWGVTSHDPAHADGLADWFFTPDQQGNMAFEDRDFSRAAELFADPLWRGYALYRDGQYEAAVEVLDRVKTAQAAFIQGMAQIKSRAYRDGVRSFETVLDRDPEYPNATENLELANRIVTYVEETRAQSDTGEDSGIGADDVVLDNESNMGADTEMKAPQEGGSGLLTTEQWMNTVDTRTGDFLRQRFAVEATRGESSGSGEASETPEEEVYGE